MNFAGIGKTVLGFLTNNSTTILTTTAVVGVISTSVLAARGTPGAQSAVDDIPSEDLSKLEVVKAALPHYAPAIISGVLTVGCIVASNRISSRKNAVLVTAYTIAERTLYDYQNKVVEIMGDKANEKVMDAVAKDRIAANPPEKDVVFFMNERESLFYDSITGRYFHSNVEKVNKAANEINYEMIHGDPQSLSDFYSKIGLPITSHSDTVGWNVTRLLEIHLSPHISEDDKPCISVEYKTQPFMHYWKMG